MSKKATSTSTSGSSATSFPSTTPVPWSSRSSTEVLLACHCGAPRPHLHERAAGVSGGTTSQQLRSVNFASTLSRSLTSSQSGALSTRAMQTGSPSWRLPRPVKGVKVAASVSGAGWANTPHISPVSAVSVPPAATAATSTTTTAEMELTSTGRPSCSVVARHRIPPKVTELACTEATWEDKDEPLSTATSGNDRRPSPSGAALMSAVEALMVDPDAPRPGRRQVNNRNKPVVREGARTAFASAVRPPFCGISSSPTPATSPHTPNGAPSKISSPAVAYVTAVPSSIVSPAPPGGAMLRLSTPQSPLGDPELAGTPEPFRRGRAAATRNLYSSAAPSSFAAATATGSSPAAPGALAPLSLLTPHDAYGSGGQRMELPLCLQGSPAYSCNPLELNISHSSHGRSSQELTPPRPTFLCERPGRTESVASMHSASDRTDAPYHFENLLDGATVSSVGEDDDLLPDTLCSFDVSGDAFEDGVRYDEVCGNDDEQNGYARGVFHRRQRRVSATGVVPPTSAAGSELELPHCQHLTSFQGLCDMDTCTTAPFDADEPTMRSATPELTTSSRSANHLPMSHMRVTGRYDSTPSYGCRGGGSTGRSAFGQSTLAELSQREASQRVQLPPLPAQSLRGLTGSGHLLADGRGGTTESSISSPELPDFISTLCSSFLMAAASFGDGAGSRRLHAEVGVDATRVQGGNRCTTTGIIKRQARRPRSTPRHRCNDGGSSCSLSGSSRFYRSLSDPHDAPIRVHDRISKTDRSAGAMGCTRSTENGIAGRSRGRGRGRSGHGDKGSDGRNGTSSGDGNGGGHPSSAPWARRVSRPSPLHLDTPRVRQRKVATAPPAAAEDGLAAGEHTGDDSAAESPERVTSTSPRLHCLHEALRFVPLATPCTTAAAAANGRENDSRTLDAREPSAGNSASSPSAASKHAQEQADIPLVRAHGCVAVSTSSQRHDHCHGLQQRWRFGLPWIVLPYGTVVVLLVLAALFATPVMSACVVPIPVSERNTSIRAEMATFMEDVAQRPAMSGKIFAGAHVINAARPSRSGLQTSPPRSIPRWPCTATKLADRAEAMTRLTYVPLSSWKPRDEMLWSPPRHGDRLGDRSAAGAVTGRLMLISDDNGEGEPVTLSFKTARTRCNSS